MSIPKIYRIIYQKDSIPMSHIWDHVRHQEWPKNPGSGNERFAGSSRGLYSRLVWRLQPVCYPCKMSHHHAKRCTVSQKNMQREDLEISWPVTKTWSFSGPPTYSQSKYIHLKSNLSAFSTKQYRRVWINWVWQLFT